MTGKRIWFSKDPTKIRLVKLSASQLSRRNDFICGGYVFEGFVDVDVKEIEGSDVLGRDGKVYSLKPEFDNDFYAVAFVGKEE